tara:strand:- start:925 stop:1713 length:789 start_codon:yes stop_codon:yes gene_type:complete
VIFKPKKSLGQNFLIDQNIIKKIVSITKIKDKEVLEIGPGSGNLTKTILEKNPKKFYVVEKDSSLCEILKNKFQNKIEIINNDILEINENNISKNELLVFGNLPYNISTEILCRWILNLKSEFWFSELVLMFQKEVADRILANKNQSNFGRLAIISNWKLSIKKMIDIKANSFFPKPKIDSTLLHFMPKKNYNEIKDSKNLEIITRVFFNQKRKMIKKPIKQIFKNPEKIYKKFNIDPNLRPQNLSLETYYELANEYEILKR